ncbi:polysaccharide deacetylase family protein [Domibacillus indicus]|uniref:polysaccharide deacetylase family protein n=1 Tax=Domibacillus indicus TaxID=1437523 RepID=UPI00203AB335|nr:polysaccharide deacetylase family protein [Domibacillus indicus]MCM3790947.1 polysaccharide deacetylase family protein [Domibacillus indicus]
MPWLFIRLKQLKWAVLFLSSVTMGFVIMSPPAEQPAISFAGQPAAIYKGNEHIALTVNVDSSSKNTSKLVNIFIDQKVTASFFVTSSWLKKHPKTAKLLVDRAFDIGVLLTDVSDDQAVEKEIAAVQKILSTYGKNSLLFIRAAEDTGELPDMPAAQGYLAVQWSVNLADQPPSELVRHVDEGDIILLNPQEDLRVTKKWLPLLLTKKKVISLSEMAGGRAQVEYIP